MDKNKEHFFGIPIYIEQKFSTSAPESYQNLFLKKKKVTKLTLGDIPRGRLA